jgi:CHAT domain-containing protein/Tfp pilus assembly protein PilF
MLLNTIGTKKRILSGILALRIGLTLAMMAPLVVLPAWGQTQSPQSEELQQLLKQGLQRTQRGEPKRAIETFQKALAIARQLRERDSEATTLNNIALVYRGIGQPQQALEFLNQALPIQRAVGDRNGEAATLSNIGLVYGGIGQPQRALEFLNQALPIWQAVGDRNGEATTLNNIGGVYDAIGQPQRVLKFLNQALPIWQAVGNRASEATALNNIGAVYIEIGQPQRALEFYNQALPILRAVGDRAGEAGTLNNIGLVYGGIGQPQQALKFYKQALPIMREVGNRSGEAIMLNNIGEVYRGIGQPRRALEFFNQALPILRAVGNRSGEATTLNNIGLVYGGIGQPRRALEFFNQASPIQRAVGDRSGEAATLSTIGAVYKGSGQPQRALEFLNQALPIQRSVGDRSGEAATLNSIGEVYRKIGQPQRALEFYKQALPIRQAVGDRAGEAGTLNNIGEVYGGIGQPQRALEFLNQAFPIQRTVGDRAGEATTLNNIGAIYNAIGQAQRALEFYKQALPIRQAVGDRNGEATTLNNIGLIYNKISQPQRALEFYNQALPILRAVGDRSGEAITLNNIGEVYGGIGKPQQALEFLNQASPIWKVVGDRASEATILNNIGTVYRDMNRPTEAIAKWEEALKLTLQTRSGLVRENRQPFLQAQRGGAVALSSLLIDRGAPDRAYEWVNLASTADLADYGRLLNAKVANPEAQTAIDQWNQQNQQLQSLRQQLQKTYSEERAGQTRTLDTQVNQQGETIARRFPEAADLFETKPADIAQLRASIPVGTTVIQPMLLADVSNVPNTIAFFILTRDKLIVIKTPINPEAFDALLTKTSGQLNNRFDDQYPKSLADLYELLIRPIEAQIQATKPKQLSIITTGKLRYLPFEALYDSKTDQYLIQKYPVSYRTRLSTRSLAAKTNSTATKQILAFGNPVPNPPLALPGAEAEVKNITQVLPGSKTFIGKEATLDAFKNQSLRFSLVHLATHGCFQKGGCPKLKLEENTILFADQRFNIADASLLGLQNTELITLSACQTALNTDSNGEEIAGLAYLFERAGARATIASLWSADDKTTQAIMVKFYENLKQGMSKGEALQKAKRSQIDSHPFFWAPFVLIGDAR